MNEARFLHLLDAYGADLSRWPSAERASAQTWAREASPAIRRAIDEAQALDAALSAHVVDGPSAALISRVARQAAAPAEPSRRGWRALAGWPAWMGVGLAGAVAGAFAASVALRVAAPVGSDGWGELPVFGGAHQEWSEE